MDKRHAYFACAAFAAMLWGRFAFLGGSFLRAVPAFVCGCTGNARMCDFVNDCCGAAVCDELCFYLFCLGGSGAES